MAHTLYGIPNCDKVRAARRWLETHAVTYRFHDLRRDGLTRERLQAWLDEANLDALLNRRGTTWRRLPDEARTTRDPERLIDSILREPTLLKRPLLEHDEGLEIGFDATRYAELLPH